MMRLYISPLKDYCKHDGVYYLLCTNKCMYTHILKYEIILRTLLHVSLPLHHLQGALILCLLKL